MRQLSFHHIIALFLGLAFLFSSCHYNKDAASEIIKGNKPSAEAVTVSHRDPINVLMQKIDTAYYYYGLVGNNYYYFKINAIGDNSISGHYYPVGDSIWLEAVPFSIECKKKQYFFQSKDNKKRLQFSLVVDTASLSGKFRVQLHLLKRGSCAFFFEPYREPSFTEYKTKRFQESIFQVNTKLNVRYGQAKGYWSSYPLPDAKYLKMLATTIGKTSSSKTLDLDMDIYMPAGDTLSAHPLIVFIHGGAFYFGDKGEEAMSKWCRHFAQTGYVTASINYRLGFKLSKASIQRCGYQAIQDAHAAIRYLVANASKYGIDTSAIFVAGTSAGAITAMNVAFLNNNTCPSFVNDLQLDQKAGLLESSGNSLSNTFRIKAVANMWGALYDLSVLGSKRIPVISFHGTEDNIVPYNEGYPFSAITGDFGDLLFDKMYGSKAIHERLKQLRIRNAFYPIEGARHSPHVDKNERVNDYFYFIQDKIQSFFLNELCENIVVTYNRQSPSEFSVNNPNVRRINWKVEGGFITNQQGNTITIVWRDEPTPHTVTISGILKNGTTFNQKLYIKHS